MKNILNRSMILTFLLFHITSGLFAQNNFTEKDRELLINLQIQIVELKVQMVETNKRLDQFIIATDKRFEQVDKRFDQMDKQFDRYFVFLGILAGLFTAITGMAIGFALWDRKTMIKPVEKEIITVKKTIDELEKTKLEKIISVFRELGKSDIKVAQVLRQFNLL